MNNFTSNLGPAIGLSSAISYPVAGFFLLLCIPLIYLAYKSNIEQKNRKRDFDHKYEELSYVEKSNFTKYEYWVENTTWWKRHKFMSFVLSSIVCFAISLTFFIGHSFVSFL